MKNKAPNLVVLQPSFSIVSSLNIDNESDSFKSEHKGNSGYNL